MKSHKDLSDNDLIDLLKQDDERALSTLYYRYWDKLLSVAVHRLDDELLASECVQDIFISLWRRRDHIDLKHSLSSYLAVAIKYRVITYFNNLAKANLKKERYLMEDTDLFAPAADQTLIEKELWESIEQTINQLPEKCRLVFKMSRQQGLSNKQIATELEISEKTVEAHMSKAIKHLRSDLTTLSPAIILWVLGSRF